MSSLLRGVEAGDDAARQDLFDALYSELHRCASLLMRGQQPGHTLQPTALVGEAYLRLFNGNPPEFDDRRHFLLAASRAMRHVLIDHARRQNAAKRDGNRVDSELNDLVVCYEERSVELESLDEALTELEGFDPTMARAIELRFFAGASVPETAETIGVPRRTFERRWAMTRNWLFQRLR